MSDRGVTIDGVWYAPSLFDDDDKKPSDSVKEVESVPEPASNVETQVELKDDEVKIEEKNNENSLAYTIIVYVLAIVGVILLATFGLAALLVLPVLGISLFSKNKFMRL